LRSSWNEIETGGCFLRVQPDHPSVFRGGARIVLPVQVETAEQQTRIDIVRMLLQDLLTDHHRFRCISLFRVERCEFFREVRGGRIEANRLLHLPNRLLHVFIKGMEDGDAVVKTSPCC
jgi:hypothetical protein